MWEVSDGACECEILKNAHREKSYGKHRMGAPVRFGGLCCAEKTREDLRGV